MRLPARHRLFKAAFTALGVAQADRWLRPLTMGVGMILMFHHVRPWKGHAFAPNASLEITPDFLRRTVKALRDKGIDIIPLDDLQQRLTQRGNPRPFAVLTFDDGYRDNIEFAAPVLRDLDAPWTLYVVDDYARGRGSLWWIDLERAIAENDDLVVDFGGTERRLPTASLNQKYEAFTTVLATLKSGTEVQLHDAMAGLRHRYRLDADALVRELCAGWDELRLLAQDPNVTIGAHTLTHPVLARSDACKAEAEIVGCKAAIESEIHMPVCHFAYPHGDAASAGMREFSLCREGGYDTAVTTRPGHIFASPMPDLWSLPRVSINGLQQSESALRALLSGVAFLPQAIRRGCVLNR